MDNKYYHRGSGEVVEFGNAFKHQSILHFNKMVASLPVIGKMEIPDYPVGWVWDDVEMVWQVMPKKSAETMNGVWLDCSKETYDDYLKGNVDRRILFLPVNKVTIKSESHAGEKKPFIVANVREILDYWNNGEGCTFSRMVEMFNEVAARQQSAAEIDRLRGEVERLKALAPLAILSGMQHGFALDRDKLFIEHCMAGKYDEVVKIWKTENNIQ